MTMPHVGTRTRCELKKLESPTLKRIHILRVFLNVDIDTFRCEKERTHTKLTTNRALLLGWG